MRAFVYKFDQDKRLDGYQLATIEDKEICEFMLNPFKRATYFRDMILQKYTVDIGIDEVVVMNNLEFKNIAFVYYQDKKIYTQHGFDEFGIQDLDDSFVKIGSLIDNVANISADLLTKAKVDRLKEIKEQLLYEQVYSQQYILLFQSMVFSKILEEEYQFPMRSVIESSSILFARNLKLVDLLSIINVDYSRAEPFIDDLIFTKTFIEREVVFEEVKQAADKHVEKEPLSKRERSFKNYVEKIKACEAETVTATLMTGRVIELKRRVSIHGKVSPVDDTKMLVDFEHIKRVKHGEEIIFEKEVD